MFGDPNKQGTIHRGGTIRQPYNKSLSFYDTLNEREDWPPIARSGTMKENQPNNRDPRNWSMYGSIEEERRTSWSNQGPAPTGHPNAGPPPYPNGWHSMDQGCRDPNSKIPHAPDPQGGIYISNLSKDL